MLAPPAGSLRVRYSPRPAAKAAAAVASPSAASYLVSPENRHVQPAQPGEMQPLRLGSSLTLDVSWVCLQHVHSRTRSRLFLFLQHGHSRVRSRWCHSCVRSRSSVCLFGKGKILGLTRT